MNIAYLISAHTDAPQLQRLVEALHPDAHFFIHLDNADAIQAITSQPFYKLPYDDGKTKYTYVVTSLNRITNESKGAKKKVKL